MFWLPLVNNCLFSSYSTVFVDEAQDMSLAQFEFIKRLQSRTLAVGDRNQSLYGFRGANPQAMDFFKSSLNAVEFPLSISYRCPRAVVQLAQTLVPQIEAWEKAEEGLVEAVDKNKFTELVQLGDMVICRFNAPLVQFALALIKKRIKATIRGRDIGKGIAKLAEKFFRGNGQSFRDAALELKQHYETEMAKPGNNEKKRNLTDKVLIIELFANEVSKAGGNTAQVPSEIEKLFSDENGAVVLSSIHRAKGLEADRVFLLQTEDPFADQRQEWEEVQEKNCLYVAYTRAKRELYLVSEE
jgi:superfamily I DNA/RNA helicase